MSKVKRGEATEDDTVTLIGEYSTGAYFRVGANKSVTVKARGGIGGPGFICMNPPCATAGKITSCHHVHAVARYDKPQRESHG